MDHAIEIPKPTRDEVEYLRGLQAGKFDGSAKCEVCGAPMGEHRIGGPGPYHPRPLKPAIYDPACYDLAEHFLQDATSERVKSLKHQLATEIQRAVETFIEYEDGLRDETEPMTRSKLSVVPKSD